MSIFTEIPKILSSGEKMGETLRLVYELTVEEVAQFPCDFVTFSVFINAGGRPTFFWVRDHWQVLRNLFIPKQSIAGCCIESGEIIVAPADDPLCFRRPAEETGLEFDWLTAIPLGYQHQKIGCFEVLTLKKPNQEELKFFEDLSVALALYVALERQKAVAQHIFHAMKNAAGAAELVSSTGARFLDQQTIITKVAGHSRNLVALARQGLSLRLDAGVDIATHDINRLVLLAAQQAEELARCHKHDDLKVAKNMAGSLEVKCSAAAMREVLVNLIRNTWEAWDARRIASRRIFFATSQESIGRQGGKFGVVIYRDNAGGMPKHIQEELFTPGVSEKGPGRGIGLAFARQIMAEQNGFIECQSQEEVGTTFRLGLPTAV